eukprot:5493560-Prymnesium_polylepis.1
MVCCSNRPALRHVHNQANSHGRRVCVCAKNVGYRVAHPVAALLESALLSVMFTLLVVSAAPKRTQNRASRHLEATAGEVDILKVVPSAERHVKVTRELLRIDRGAVAADDGRRRGGSACPPPGRFGPDRRWLAASVHRGGQQRSERGGSPWEMVGTRVVAVNSEGTRVVAVMAAIAVNSEDSTVAVAHRAASVAAEGRREQVGGGSERAKALPHEKLAS